MNSLAFSAVFICGCFLALGTLRLLSVHDSHPEPIAKFGSFDGLRGFAAFAVFFHHAAYWRTYALERRWASPTHLAWVVGPTAVSLFFMITAFLFIDKVVFSARPTDWTRLYLSRLLRMMPLFLFVFVLILIIVATRTGAVNESLVDLFIHVGQWLPLTLLGTPDINRLDNTWMTVAGATWTLPYECLFYLALPMIAVLCGRRVTVATVAFLSIAFIAVYIGCIAPGVDSHTLIHRLAPFPAGAATAVLVRSHRWREVAKGNAASFVALAGGFLSLYLPVHYSTNAVLLFPSITFAVIAGGNSLFGSLVGASARSLGQISYSVYLLHGVVLYVLLNQSIGLENVARLSTFSYWVVMLALVPVLMLLSRITYRLIERPAIDLTDRCAVTLRRMVNSALADKAA